jgi:hypothetical protein
MVPAQWRGQYRIARDPHPTGKTQKTKPLCASPAFGCTGVGFSFRNRTTGWNEISMASERERELRRRRKRRKEVLKERIRVARKSKKKKRA